MTLVLCLSLLSVALGIVSIGFAHKAVRAAKRSIEFSNEARVYAEKARAIQTRQTKDIQR